VQAAGPRIFDSVWNVPNQSQAVLGGWRITLVAQGPEQMSAVDRSHARRVAGPWQEYETGSSGRVCRRDVDCREMEGNGDLLLG
jgi:hypothetical protein